MPNKIDDAVLYDKYYFQEHYQRDPLRDKMYQQEFQRIMECRPPEFPAGRILDVGCGVGNFLDLFYHRDWKCYGVEPSDYARAQCARKGFMTYRDFNAFTSESMDIVVFRGTLQHIAYPMDALAQATRVLRKGGMLVILATPNTDSLVYQIWKTLPALEPQRNWVLWGESGLVNVLKRLGFFIIRREHPYLGTPYAHPVRDTLKFITSLVLGYRKFAFWGSMMELYALKEDRPGFIPE